MKVEANLNDAYKLLKKRGLEPDGRIQQMFTSKVARELNAYVPFETGTLRNTRIIGTDTITYDTPYARNMYYGKVMVDPVTKAAGFLTKDGWRSRKGVKKIVSDREYNYHGAPKRGKLWDKRMWADKKDKIINEIAKAAGGKVK